MRRLHIDDDVEGLVRKRQVFGIAADEIQPRERMAALAKADAFGVQVETDVIAPA
jgi:hypothetical protein